MDSKHAPDPLTAFWGRALGQPFLDQMKAFGDGLSMPFPFGAEGADPAGVDGSVRRFYDIVESCLRLTSEVARVEANTLANEVTRELLMKLLDPREWLSATGLVDANLRRLTDAPKFADLWQVESKFVALFKAWSEARTVSAEQARLILSAWMSAATEFVADLDARTKAGAPLARKEMVDAWVEIANRHLLEVQRSAPYLEILRRVLRATTDLRVAQNAISERYGEVLGIPTRVEVDDISRMVADLRRELREHQRVGHADARSQ